MVFAEHGLPAPGLQVSLGGAGFAGQATGQLERDQELRAAGFRVVHFTWDQLFREQRRGSGYGARMTGQRINPAELARPSGFSHAVSVPAGARLVFLAGQTGCAADGRIVPGGLVAQFGQALRNLLAALAAAGGKPGHLASVTIYATSLEEYRAASRDIGELWRDLAGTGYPAMAAVQVSRLWDPEALVELHGVAAIG